MERMAWELKCLASDTAHSHSDGGTSWTEAFVLKTAFGAARVLVSVVRWHR
jgi:hypothetical protein